MNTPMNFGNMAGLTAKGTTPLAEEQVKGAALLGRKKRRKALAEAGGSAIAPAIKGAAMLTTRGRKK